jgi:hypothetical protein
VRCRHHCDAGSKIDNSALFCGRTRPPSEPRFLSTEAVDNFVDNCSASARASAIADPKSGKQLEIGINNPLLIKYLKIFAGWQIARQISFLWKKNCA